MHLRRRQQHAAAAHFQGRGQGAGLVGRPPGRPRGHPLRTRRRMCAGMLNVSNRIIGIHVQMWQQLYAKLASTSFPFSPCQGEAAPWHGTPLLSYAPPSPSPLSLASMSSAPALRPTTSAQTVATTTAQHFDFSNPASLQQQPSHAAQHVLLHHLNASAQAESPRSPPSTPQTPQHAHISQHTTTPSPTVLRLHHHLHRPLRRHWSRLQPALRR